MLYFVVRVRCLRKESLRSLIINEQHVVDEKRFINHTDEIRKGIYIGLDAMVSAVCPSSHHR